MTTGHTHVPLADPRMAEGLETSVSSDPSCRVGWVKGWMVLCFLSFPQFSVFWILFSL